MCGNSLTRKQKLRALLKISHAVDWLNTVVGKLTMWLILSTTLISAGNALVRKIFDSSSNSLLEIQWYLFAGFFCWVPVMVS